MKGVVFGELEEFLMVVSVGIICVCDWELEYERHVGGCRVEVVAVR